MDNDYPQRFADAIVSEVKAEMGRRNLSSRALGRLIGKSSQYMSDRLDGGNSKTGKRVVLNVSDLYVIADALGIDAADLTSRADRIARSGENVIVGRFGVRDTSQDDLGAVARRRDADTGEDTDAP